jgi:hypothetical protein
LNQAGFLIVAKYHEKRKRGPEKERSIREIKVHPRTYIHTYRKVERLPASKSKVQTIMIGNDVTENKKNLL